MPESSADRVQRIFSQALQQPARERAAFVQQRCGDDEAIQAQILDLLGALDEASANMNDPTRDAAGPDLAGATVYAPVTEQPGVVIDRYKLLQPIGEGGFGVVYMSEQTEPVNRRVALKIIKLGMDTKQVIARFEAERQALAIMDHPNIAKVLDAGTTSGGRPYFVMELVKGVPITEYCDRHNLDVNARLALFQQVCHAVQHAHQKGIIHRDIKPSNVMITLHDGKPVPKVIDFGIAKATNARLTEKTVFTEYRQFIGTPEYMSPEQAEMSGLDIDTRSDVYSLGVLLYELLTGTTPFDPRKLRSAGYGEIQRIIREETPPKPSTRLSTLETLPSIAANRHTEPKKLGMTIRGDLDWIVMKALEKDRTRRYETANGFAMDIQRYLTNEPVLASPPSTAYRLRKFVRRNHRTLTAVSAVFIALVAGVIGSTWFAINAAEARNRAQQEQSIAQAERQVAEASLDFMIKLFEIPDPSESRGNAITAREILDRGVEQIRGRFAHQPGIRGRLLHTMGLVYINIGLFREAIPLLQGAVEARRSVASDGDADVAASKFHLGEAHHYNAEFDVAERLYRESLELRQALYGPDHAEVARSLDLLARALRDQGNVDEAEAIARKGLTMRERLLASDHADLSESHQTLGSIDFERGDLEAAERQFRRAYEIRRAALGDDHAEIPELLNALGRINSELGNWAQAIEDLERGLEMSRRLFGPDHQYVAHMLFQLGMLLHDQGRLDEAELMYAEAIEIYRAVYDEHNTLTPAVIQTIGTLLHDRKDFAGAEARYREAITLWHAIGPAGELGLANTLKNLGETLKQLERLEEAERSFLEAHAIYARRLGDDNPATVRLIDYLVPLYEEWGKPDLAAEWRERRQESASDDE